MYAKSSCHGSHDYVLGCGRVFSLNPTPTLSETPNDDLYSVDVGLRRQKCRFLIVQPKSRNAWRSVLGLSTLGTRFICQ